jgi:hypothetical protein
MIRQHLQMTAPGEKNLMVTKADLEKRLLEVEAEIQEARRRLPAHSVKPLLMAALFALEDERDDILYQLSGLPESQ